MNGAHLELDLLPAGWWVRGEALQERAERLRSSATPDLAVPNRPGTAVDERGADERQLVAQWRDRHGSGLSRRLRSLHIDETMLGRILAGAGLAAATEAKPSWVRVAETAVAAAGHRPATPGQHWRDAFATVLAPFVEVGVAQVRHAISDCAGVDRAPLLAGFAKRLGDRLVQLATPTLVAQLHHQREAGKLRGDDGAQRFTDFVSSMTSDAALAHMLCRYPVLARLLGQTTDQMARSLAQTVHRLAADWSALLESVLDGVEPGLLADADSGVADTHAQGQATTVLTFTDGVRLVYKPRDVQAQERLASLLHWVNARLPELALRAPRVLARAGYGWVEYIAPQPLGDAGLAELFYRRLGALLALMHATHATDIHCENVIAAGDQPVIIDAETLLHHPSAAELGGTGDPAADLLAGSVHRTGMLPLLAVGDEGVLDLSCVGATRDAVAPTAVADWVDAGTDLMRAQCRALSYQAGHNRPRVGEAEVDPCDYEAALLDGFVTVYDTMVVRRGELLALVEACAAVPVRLVVRPTWAYQQLMRDTLRAPLLADALRRDLAFGVLWTASGDDAYLHQFEEYEIDDLWRGDVPLFLGKAGSTELFAAASGDNVVARTTRTALDISLAKITNFGVADRQDQAWIVSATLATRRGPQGHGTPTLSGPLGATAAEPQRLVTLACTLADQLVARGIPGHGRVSWLGLENVNDRQWLVLPMGAGLTQGYLGVALFLAQVARISEVPRYAEVARQAVRDVPALFALLADRPDLAQAIGPGGLAGFGGIAYGLARLALLLDEPSLTELALEAAQFAAAALPADSGTDSSALGWVDGIAGCLSAMDAVHAMTGSPVAHAVGQLCADRLLATAPVPTEAGFASGAAGIGTALVRHAAHDSSTQVVGQRLLTNACTSVVENRGWCDGAAGAMLAAIACDDPGAHSAVAALADVLGAEPPLRDLSLCHGQMGIAEALITLSQAGVAKATVDVASALRHRAGQIVSAIEWHGAWCGTPGGVLTPGFLNGLSGIGYGLLRLAMPDVVPSALLLQAPPRA